MGEDVTGADATRLGEDGTRIAIQAAAIYNEPLARAFASFWLAENQDNFSSLGPEAAADLMTETVYTTGMSESVSTQYLNLFLSVTQDYSAAKAAAASAQPQPTPRSGDPVEPFRGELVHEQTDLVVRGAGIDFAFVRTYRNQTAFNGPLGFKWDHAYDTTLKITDPEARLWTGTMRAESYQRHANWGQDGFNYYVPQDGVHATLEPIGVPDAPTGWARRAPDGMRHEFEPDPSWDGGFRLARIEDRFGNYLAFFYIDDLLRKVEVNSAARWVELAYDALNRIVRVGDHTGRAWTYLYDDYGDLVLVTTPATPGFPEGNSTSLFYSSSEQNGALAHNLTSIIDAAGRGYLETRYGEGLTDYNRVVWQRIGGGVMRYAYEPVDPVFDGDLPPEDSPTLRVRITERNGFETVHIFNGLGSLLRKEECWFGATGHEHVIWRFRFNRDGLLVASRTPEGVVTHFIYGRTQFLREQPTADEDALSQNPYLTADVRRGFARVLTEIHRGQLLAGSDFDWNEHWGDPYQADPDDIVVKHTYEPAYGQPLTTSDTRTTTSPDPNGVEGPAYDQLLTRFEYTGPATDPTLALQRVVHPTPTRADGTAYGSVVEEILERDDSGRVLRRRDAVGTDTTYTYYSPSDGAKEGFLHELVADAANVAGTTPLTITTRYDVDDLGRVTATTRPRGVASDDGRFIVRTTFDALDRVTSARGPTPLDTETRTFYEATGQVARTETDWLSPGLVELGPVVRTLVYDEEHHVTRETIGGVDTKTQLLTRHTYNESGQRSLTLLPEGNDIRFKYDQRLQIVATVQGFGSGCSATARVTYDRDGRQIRATSPEGRETNYSVDAFGRAVATTDAVGNVTRSTFDKAGRAVVVRHFEKRSDGTYWLLARAEIDYDELGRTRREIANRFDSPLLATDLDHDYETAPGPGTRVVTTFEFDSAGRITSTIDPLGNRTETAYDSVGRAATTTDALGNRVELQYDANSNVIRRDQRDVVRDPTSGAITGEEVFSWVGTYDERDRLVSETDALGNTTKHEYDTLDRRVKTIDPLGNVVLTGFDVYGRRVSVTHVRTSTGDGTGPATDPAITQFEFDGNGNQKALIDPLGRRTDFRHDTLDRLVERVFPAADATATDRASIRLHYDRDNLEVRRRDAHGAMIITKRDGLGRPVNISVDLSLLDADVTVEGTKTITRVFDGLGRTTHAENETASIDATFDSLGNARSTTTTVGGQALTLVREYDNASALSALVYPGGRRIEHDRDGLHRLVDVRHVADGVGYPGIAGQVPRKLVTLDRVGARVRSIDYGNRTRTEQAFDAGGRLIQRHHLGPDAGSGRPRLLLLQYLHDGARNPRLRFESSAAPSVAERFSLDSEYQLLARRPEPGRAAFYPTTIAPAASPTATIANVQAAIEALLGPAPGTTLDNWTLDLAGNRLKVDLPSGGSDTYAPNDLDQYASIDGTIRTYDRAGNLRADGKREFRFDAFHRLVRVIDGTGVTLAAYDYGPDGSRTAETHGTERLVVLHDGLDRISEYKNGALVAQYVHGDRIDQPLHLAEDTSGVAGEHWVHTDAIGSIRLLTDSVGAEEATRRYSPFGELESNSGTTYCPLGFTARPFDANVGLYDFRARTYDAAVGRFIQRDPGGYVDGANLYAYAGNGPLRFSDPSGLGRSETNHPWYVDPDAHLWPARWDGPSWYQRAWSATKGFASGVASVPKDVVLGATDAVVDTAKLPYHAAREGIHLGYLVATGRPVRAAKELAGDVAAPVVGVYKLGAYVWSHPGDALQSLSVRNVVRYGLPMLFGGEAGEASNAGRAGATASRAGELAETGQIARAGEEGARAYSTAFETTLSPGSYPGVSRARHFQEANEHLLSAVEQSPDFAQQMRNLGIELDRTPTGLAPRTPPPGWSWHHEVEPGLMRLVPRGQHTPGSPFWGTLHPQGRGGWSIWGAGDD